MIRSRLGELVRFVATGTASVALNVLIVLGLTEYLHLHYLASIAVCFVTVTLISFWLNRSWTFRKRDGRAGQDFARYLVVTAMNMMLCLALCALGVELLHLQYAIVMVMLSVAFVPLNFLFHRRWSFGLRWLDRRT